MSYLTLVRHGQARPFERDGDRLSSLEEVQAGLLGEFLARSGFAVGEVYSGSLLRQIQTAEIAGKRLAEQGGSWPPLQTLKEFDEYDATSLTGEFADRLAAQDRAFARLRSAYREARADPERRIRFQRMFERLVTAWLDGAVESAGIEPWDAFLERVEGGISRIVRAQGRGRSAVVFTSGGPIGLAVRMALDAPARSALEVNWRVRNTSLTHFVFSEDRLSLDAFNSLPHIADPSLETFR